MHMRKGDFDSSVLDLLMLEDAIESVSSGFVLFSADGRLLHVNRRAREFISSLSGFGASATDTRDRFIEFVANKIYGDFDPEKKKKFGAGDINSQVAAIDGRSLLVQANDFCSGGTCILLTDISATHVHTARFYQGQKLEALGQLAAGVAHDFNNLLSIVDGYARMAQKTADPEGKTSLYLERIKQAIKRGSGLTRQLLTFGRHKISAETVTDLGALMQEQEAFLRPLLGASVNMTVTAQEDLFVEVAPDNLAQIIVNLVLNARDAMPEGGAIIVDGCICGRDEVPVTIMEEERDKSYVCLSVIDSGIGMTPQVIERIFDPFFTTKDQGKGTGLGLSMVYGVVRQAGGVIDVRSAPGEGTAMNLYFPLSQKKPQIKKIIKGDEGKEKARFEGYTVLLAEDEEDLLHVVQNMLEDAGMKVLVARNGNEALLKQEEYDGQIDLVLTDVVMPQLNGLRMAELFQEVRPESRVIFMSGYPARGAMAQIQLPADACFLAKPVEYDKMIGLIYDQVSRQDGTEDYISKAQNLSRWETGT